MLPIFGVAAVSARLLIAPPGRASVACPDGMALIESVARGHFCIDRALYPSANDRTTFAWHKMNDPRLNQVPGSLAKSGAFSKCRNSYGVYDMIGNLHEWTSERGGTFRGGFYLDNTTHGLGCIYRATGHSPTYRDYSTGFRCCADARG